MTAAALIVAAGRGRRLGGETPKQYLPLAGPCSLRRATEAFLALDAIRSVCVVIHPDDAGLCADALRGLTDPRVLAPVPGGNTRAQSVRLGLEALLAQAPETVLIHDAARPFVSEEIIRQVLAALEDCDGACAALPLVDALWRSEDGLATVPVSREGVWRAQTPQGFRYDAILAAHRVHDGSADDDVAVARGAGLEVRLVRGSERNYKITTADDLARALADIGREAGIGGKEAGGADPG